ncbi:methyltransferase domain-containing protein [Alcaligenes sp. SORT26]|uniref:methyltransferase n=1 Tax=Alcaligenes sp. SORT26 TaxID=2813780 RepID=UPI001A9F1E48|nr:methyltransferase [Alcaligenes sp. SORT26]QTB98583.1 methyltransferase domain-containing protein [Alcaligenes sp. SORT26]
MNSDINTKKYWENRFATDWADNLGPEQSKFFATVAMDNLPSWLIQVIRSDGLAVADWGCAQGDGLNVLTNFFNPKKLTGIDFSSESIATAKSKYPELEFLDQNWLDDQGLDDIKSYDFIFSSNTLEHFHNPFDVLIRISEKAELGLILALPYRELDRIDEHFFTFTDKNVPVAVNGFDLVWSKVVDCSILPSSMWDGDQIILVYANKKWFDQMNLTLGNMHIESGYESDSLSRHGVVLAHMENEFSRVLKDSLEQVSESLKKLSISKAELQEQVTKNQRLQERNADLQNVMRQKDEAVNAIRLSTSWKLTRPLRVLARLVRNPLRFWGDARNYVAWKRRLIQSAEPVSLGGLAAVTSVPGATDLSWDQFEANVLVHRDKYKGVFVQSVAIDWTVPLFQRPQHIASAMGRSGYLVIYETRSLDRDNLRGVRYMGDNVWLVNAPESANLKGVLRSIYSTAYAVVPEYGPHLLEGNTMIYEYIDHIDPAISGNTVESLLKLKNYAFSGDADYIVASSKALVDESITAVGKDKVLFVANGVDCQHYRQDWTHIALPDEYTKFLKRYKRIVGYFGALAPWLWYEVLAELATRMPACGFVYLGPDYFGGSEKLPKTDNVIWLGPINYSILPAYSQHFDVAIIPFEPGEIARTTSPLKLFEYFAMEVPVVVTSAMDECTIYPEVFSASSVDEYVERIQQAFDVKDDPAYQARLRQMADENDWKARIETLVPLFPNGNRS